MSSLFGEKGGNDHQHASNVVCYYKTRPLIFKINSPSFIELVRLNHIHKQAVETAGWTSRL